MTKIEYLVDKNRIVSVLQERLENCEHTIYALEKVGVNIIYMVYDNELRRVARITDGQDREQLNKAFLSELPMTADIAEQTTDLVVWL
jgi:hypothetical protein